MNKLKGILNSQGGGIWITLSIAVVGAIITGALMIDYSTAICKIWFWAVVVLILCILWVLFWFYPRKLIIHDSSEKQPAVPSIRTMEEKNADEEAVKEIEEELTQPIPYNWKDSELYFSESIAQAFPGDRDIVWYRPGNAVRRLKFFFEDIFKKVDGGDAIWWRRGSQAFAVKDFEIIDTNKVLLQGERFKISRMAVVVPAEYYKCFIYIEADPEVPTGLYPIQKINPLRGYATEEYAEFKGRLITRQEYDDGATVIGERVVKTNGEAKLRVRYLSKVNFILTPKNSPYTNRNFEIGSSELFDKSLQDVDAVNELFDFMATFKKEDMPEHR